MRKTGGILLFQCFAVIAIIHSKNDSKFVEIYDIPKRNDQPFEDFISYQG